MSARFKAAPELAAAAIGKWLVYAVGESKGIDMHQITLEAATCEREAAKRIVITTGDVPVFKLKAICARIRRSAGNSMLRPIRSRRGITGTLEVGWRA